MLDIVQTSFPWTPRSREIGDSRCPSRMTRMGMPSRVRALVSSNRWKIAWPRGSASPKANNVSRYFLRTMAPSSYHIVPVLLSREGPGRGVGLKVGGKCDDGIYIEGQGTGDHTSHSTNHYRTESSRTSFTHSRSINHIPSGKPKCLFQKTKR